MIYAAETMKGFGYCEVVALHATLEGAKKALETRWGTQPYPVEWLQITPTVHHAMSGDSHLGRVRGFDLQV